MKAKQTESKPDTVSRARRGTRPDGDIRARWAWVEPAVWTTRMLTALEKGVRGGKWHALIDKVYSLRNLRAAFCNVAANGGSPGVDHVTIEMFEARLDENLDRLSTDLRSNRYRPQAIKRVWIAKPGRREKRPLGIPTVRDRVVQAALKQVIEPIFERDFASHSYGFRPGYGCKDALRRVDELLRAENHFVVDADLKSYFDTISHDRLLALMRTKISDSRILALIGSFLNQRVLETARHWIPEQGTPQGAVMSPLLSNIFLDPLDHVMEATGFSMVRYADDFVILCSSPSAAQRALSTVHSWTGSVGLALHPDKTAVVDARERGGFDFLGYHFERGYRWPRSRSLRKLKDSLRSRTRRTNGMSLSTIISDVNPLLEGWFAYFQHSHSTTFRPLDQWMRMRLRSILRRRMRLRGRGRGADHQRWRNAFFAELGLFSFVTAHAQASQSSPR